MRMETENPNDMKATACTRMEAVNLNCNLKATASTRMEYEGYSPYKNGDCDSKWYEGYS